MSCGVMPSDDSGVPRLLLRVAERLLELRRGSVDFVLHLHRFGRAGGLQHVEVSDVRLVHAVAGVGQPLRRTGSAS